MNKVIMFIWGSIITLLCVLIFMIGYKERDKDYMAFESSLKRTVVSYLKNNNIATKSNQSIIIFSDDLVSHEYMNDTDLKKYCIKKIIYKRGIIKDKFIFEKECDKEE